MTFDESCIFNSEEKEEIAALLEKLDKESERANWGKYTIAVNESTSANFESFGTTFDKELEGLANDLKERYPNEDNLGVMAYLSQGYAKSEFEEDASDPLFESFLSNVVDMAMNDRFYELTKDLDSSER